MAYVDQDHQWQIRFGLKQWDAKIKTAQLLHFEGSADCELDRNQCNICRTTIH